MKNLLKQTKNNPSLFKLDLKMKLSALLLFTCIFALQANESYSQKTKVTVDLEQVTVEKLIDVIEEKTKYRFLYIIDDVDLDRVVSIKAKRERVNYILDRIFKGTNTGYSIDDRQISLTKRIILESIPQEGVVAPIQNVIMGTVSDKLGAPLPGANIIEKGTVNGTQSDFDGNFSLEITDEKAVLVVSYIGFVTKEILIDGETNLNIILEESSEGLDEVVVVAYGTQKKVSLTSAISQISGEDIIKRPVADASQSLQGLAAGVTVIDQGGRPGNSEVAIRFRGVSSLGNNNPLIIVDGIEQRLGDVNPDDIESISLLKDASSTAIYGSRGGNGVILLTTKRAKSGELSIDYHGYSGIQQSNNNPKHLGLREYLELEQVARVNGERGGLSINGFDVSTPEGIDTYVNQTDRDQYPLPYEWWENGNLLKTAPQMNHTLSISGGSENVKARGSLRHQTIEGIIPNVSNKINEIRLNADFKASDKLSFSLGLNYRQTKNQQPERGVGNIFNRTLHGGKFSVPRYSTGEYGIGPQRVNPLIWAELGGTSDTRNDLLITQMTGIYEILPGLKYTLDVGFRNDAFQNSTFQNSYTVEDPITERVQDRPINSLTESFGTTRELTMTQTLGYQKSIGLHNFGMLIGYQTIDNTSKNINASRIDFFNNEIRSLDAGSQDILNNGGLNSKQSLRSFFGRANYNYKEKYILELAGRYDGSSRFSEKNRFAFFPSFSAAWRLSEEDFWGNLSNTINEAKLRVSWGESGNQSIGLFQFFPAFNPSSYSFNGQVAQGFAETQLINPNLTWETIEQFNVAIETNFWNNRFGVTLEYYDKLTDGILLTLPIDPLIGLNPSAQNAGIISNKGWESTLSLRGGNKFKYDIGFNYTYNANVVEDLAETGPIISGGGENRITIIDEGLSIGSLYGYRTDGFFQSANEIAGTPTLQSNTQPGDVKYIDLNDDGIINSDDWDVLGQGFPPSTFGTTFNLTYKDFQLFMQWQGAAGNKTLFDGGLGHQATFEAFTHENFADYWTEDNRDARWPRPIKGNLRNLQASDLKLLDASYLRLKNITLTYNFNSKLLKGLPLRAASVYIGATNVLTFSELTDWGIDPESTRSRGNYYPQVGIYTAGIKLNF